MNNMFHIPSSALRKSLTAISFIIAIPASAQFIELPTIESIPFSLLLSKENDREALRTAQRTLLTYTDYLIMLKQRRNVLNEQFIRKQETFAKFLDEETMISSKLLFFMVATGYVYTTQKSYTIGFKDPIYHPLKHYISISETSIITGVRMQF